MSTLTIERPGTRSDEVEHEETCAGLIRRGCRYHPQGQGMCYNYNTGTTCALGALVTGLLGADYFEQQAIRLHPHRAPLNPYGHAPLNLADMVQERTGVSLDQSVPLPGRATLPCPLKNAIVYLNDQYGWTREDIADWLESLGF